MAALRRLHKITIRERKCFRLGMKTVLFAPVFILLVLFVMGVRTNSFIMPDFTAVYFLFAFVLVLMASAFFRAASQSALR